MKQLLEPGENINGCKLRIMRSFTHPNVKCCVDVFIRKLISAFVELITVIKSAQREIVCDHDSRKVNWKRICRHFVKMHALRHNGIVKVSALLLNITHKTSYHTFALKKKTNCLTTISERFSGNCWPLWFAANW